MGFVNSVLPLKDTKAEERQVQPIKIDSPKKMGKLLKAASLALGLNNSSIGARGQLAGGKGTFEDAPYDFDQIIAAIDTDSYAKQAFAKYQELMWKEGYELLSENPEALDYIYERFDYMEMVMQMPIQEFFKDVTDQLCKFHNSVIAVVRNDRFRQVFPGKLRPSNDKGPIVGYEIIPIETVRIQRDKHNKPVKYLQELDGFGGWNQPKAPEWDASEIIHLTIDRKPGYVFGTPFMTAAIEDILALRSMEEDIQNLVHQQLFPIVDVTVGTEEYPGDDDEVNQAAREISEMTHDGALIHTERRKIEIIGSEGAALDATGYLNAAQQRVATGLGLYPHHLGMLFAGGNRNMTEQLDIALYDRIKTYQRYVASMIVLMIINPLMREGGYRPQSNPSMRGRSDRCIFRFKEIDTDTRVKKDSHEINKFANNLQTIEETRQALGLPPEMDESGTVAALQARMMPDQVLPGKEAKPGGEGKKAQPASPPTKIDTTPSGAARGDAQKSSTGGAPNQRNTRRDSGNKMRPQNQHGRSLSPNIRHSAENVLWLDVAEILSKQEEEY